MSSINNLPSRDTSKTSIPSPMEHLSSSLNSINKRLKSIFESRSYFFLSSFGVHSQTVNSLESEKFSLLQASSSLYSSRTDLKKISMLVQKEILLLNQQKIMNKNREEQIQAYKILQQQIDQKILPRIEASSWDEMSLEETSSHSKEHSFFSKFSEPHFSFTLKIKGEQVEVHGAGLTDKGKLKATGAFGRVFFGNLQGEDIAVKVLKPKAPLLQLNRETLFLIKMQNSSHVIGAQDVIKFSSSDSSQGVTCLVMEKINGVDLTEGINAFNSVKEGLRALCDQALGLKELHDNGIIHRDVKLSNMMWDQQKTKGIMTDLGGCIYELDSIQGQNMGTPPYYSPENLNSEKQTKASDVYSFGLAMYCFLTGDILAKPVATLEGYRSKKRTSEDLKVSPEALLMLPQEHRRECAGIIGDCLKRDQSKRVSSEVLASRLESFYAKIS